VLGALRRLFRGRRDEEPVKVIVGLGNPGRDYERTRHNVGWMVVDHLAGVWQFDAWRRDGDARVASGSVGAERARLVKPQTYMNLSGGALRPYLRRTGWSPQRDLLVVVDDVALPLGRVRLRARGSAGGHNGLKSIEAALGHQDYARLRIGIGPPADRRRGDLADYVLDEFGKAELKEIHSLLPTFREAVEAWLHHGIEKAMNEFNRGGE
jgi:PTH1 family peptidyl-tRNA hydrolase